MRTGYVFGGGDDYLSGQLARLRAGEDAAGLADRIGSPTFVEHLAERLLPLALTGRFGTYHLAGPEPASWFDVLGRLRDLGGLSGDGGPQRAAELGVAGAEAGAIRARERLRGEPVASRVPAAGRRSARVARPIG